MNKLVIINLGLVPGQPTSVALTRWIRRLINYMKPISLFQLIGFVESRELDHFIRKLLIQFSIAFFQHFYSRQQLILCHHSDIELIHSIALLL